MRAIIYLINEIGQILIYVLIAQAILSWLMAFGIINTYNRVVYSIVDLLNRITEPLLRPIRRFLPNLGGLDISPVVLILLINAVLILINDNVRYLMSM